MKYSQFFQLHNEFPLNNLLASRPWILVATFLTGVSGLIYQAVWHRYMGIMLGAEARSSSLVIAIFLFGLSSGYFFWGRFTQKVNSRTRLLKSYGLLEAVIGLWGMLFPFLFLPVRSLSVMLPISFLIDLCLTVFLIFPPTFLMGATIPLLTAILPSNESEVNILHAKIYGWNTLGAFVGILLAGLVLIHTTGLIYTSLIAGGLNLFVALFFVFNKLEGNIQSKRELPWIENNFHPYSLYGLVFVTGAVTISMEIMWIRLWGLTVGASSIVFPLVVSIFVAGLALGSLFMGKISLEKFYRNLLMGLFILVLIFFTVPHFPLWVSFVRVSLSSTTPDFYLFQLITYGMLLVALLPFLFFIGRILPMAYALTKKNVANYGQQCGFLYFANTIGTFFGAVILSYFLLYWVDFDTIFKINVGLLAVAACYFFLQGKKYVFMGLVSSLVLLFMPLASWNRAFHKEGIFRINYKTVIHQQGPFFIPTTMPFTNIFFDDGVTMTVSANKYEDSNEIAVYNNAKSDSTTSEDFSTLALAGILPYLFQPQEKKLKTMVIGLATGVTAGLVGRFEDVSSVDVIEISDSMVKAATLLSKHNYQLTENPKIKVHEMDAFKYMEKTPYKYDFIISEPTNPWTSGVENLFTPEFYQSVNNSLTKDGIFLQWMHLYEMDENVFATVVKNLRTAFPDITLFRLTGEDDIAFINIPKGRSPSEFASRRFSEKHISQAFYQLGIPNLEALEVLRAMVPAELAFLSSSWKTYNHELQNPQISLYGLVNFYTKSRIYYDKLIPPDFSRKLRGEESQKLRAFPILHKWFNENRNYCDKVNMAIRIGRSPFCSEIGQIMANYQQFFAGQTLEDRLRGYATLRTDNFLAYDSAFLLNAFGQIIERWNKDDPSEVQKSLYALFDQVVLEGQWQLLQNLIDTLFQKNLIPIERKRQLEQITGNHHNAIENLERQRGKVAR